MINCAGSSGTVKSLGTSGGGDRIGLVLVDDDDDYREAASGELEDLGFDVWSFADGADMLAAFSRGLAADVIVLDWYMPAMMGIDVLARLRRAGHRLPIVFLTGHATPGLRELALERGAADFLDKTAGLPQLASRVRRLLGFVDACGAAGEKPQAEW